LSGRAHTAGSGCSGASCGFVTREILPYQPERTLSGRFIRAALQADPLAARATLDPYDHRHPTVRNLPIGTAPRTRLARNGLDPLSGTDQLSNASSPSTTIVELRFLWTKPLCAQSMYVGVLALAHRFGSRMNGRPDVGGACDRRLMCLKVAALCVLPWTAICFAASVRLLPFRRQPPATHDQTRKRLWPSWGSNAIRCEAAGAAASA